MCGRKNHRMIVALVAGLVMSVPTLAETAAEEIKRINEQIAVLSARLTEVEFKAKIAAKEAELAKLQRDGRDGNAPGTHTASSPLAVNANPVPTAPAVAQEEIPVVRSIDGMDGKLRATLALRGGVVQSVGVGEKFGAWTTKEISVSAVTLVKGKEVVRLAFGNEPPAPSTGGGGSFGLGAPPAPALPSPFQGR